MNIDIYEVIFQEPKRGGTHKYPLQGTIWSLWVSNCSTDRFTSTECYQIGTQECGDNWISIERGPFCHIRSLSWLSY